MRGWQAWGAVFIATLWASPMWAASVPDGVPQVKFTYERVGLPVPQYSITVGKDGSALYEGQESLKILDEAEQNGPPAALRPFHKETTVSPATAKKIFAMAAALKQFHANCASKAKNIADTGAKTLEYKGPEGSGECRYNYSDNKTVTQLTNLFLGMAETMNEGRELDHLHRYDRLGLDAAMATLSEQVDSGQALAVETIAGTLRSLASDTAVIERVRLKASKLLSLVPPEMQRASQ